MPPSVPPVPPYVPPHGLLAGRSVLVTAAAGGGIGLATARRVLEEGARALVIADIHPRRLEEAKAALQRDFADRKIHPFKDLLCGGMASLAQRRRISS